mgnify:CR=1 FL=1
MTSSYDEQVEGQKKVANAVKETIQAEEQLKQKKQEEQKEDMQREYPSYPKEAFDLAIK